MNSKMRLPDCPCPETVFEKLCADDPQAWEYVRLVHNDMLEYDIEKSVRKAIRQVNADLLDIKQTASGDIPRMIMEFKKQAWQTFRQEILTGNFEFKSHEETYNYLRVIAWQDVRSEFRTLRNKAKRLQKQTPLSELQQEDDFFLENFLFRHGGYVDDDIEQRLILEERIKEIMDALDELDIKSEHRRILLYSTVHGMSADEIAREIGMTPESVHVTRSRLIKKLRAYLLK